MDAYAEKVAETVAYIKSHGQPLPEIGLLTGTGLGGIAESIAPGLSLNYEDIPNFPVATVQSHTGRLLVGEIAGRSLIVLQGRFHLYEGYSAKKVTFPIRVLQELGIRILVVSNAAGGLNPSFEPGDIMIITDHMNLTGENPLIGPNESQWGTRFPDMSRAYDADLFQKTFTVGSEIGIRLKRGVYAGLKGPSLETPAEVRFLRTIGADAVGFSTVQEVIAAVHGGIRVLGLSIITNVHDPECPVSVTVDDVVATANAVTPQLKRIIEALIGHLD